jgi:hypothetical protein
LGESLALAMTSHSRRSKGSIGPHSLDILSILFGSLLGDLINATTSPFSRMIILSRYYLSPTAKAAIQFPPYVLQVITGMLLGDSWLSKPTSSGQSAFGVQQKQLDFVQFLWEIFNPLGIVGALPYTSSRFDTRTSKTYTISGFLTVILPFFGILYHKWYTIVEGKVIKQLPANIYDLLTPVALAFWIAGDGSYSPRDGVTVLSTESFTPEEVALLVSIINQKNEKSLRQ